MPAEHVIGRFSIKGPSKPDKFMYFVKPFNECRKHRHAASKGKESNKTNSLEQWKINGKGVVDDGDDDMMMLGFRCCCCCSCCSDDVVVVLVVLFVARHA